MSKSLKMSSIAYNSMRKILLTFVITVFTTFSFAGISLANGVDSSSYTHGMMGFGTGSGLLGWIFMALWWVLVILGLVMLVRWLASSGSEDNASERSALDILKKRYAKGEISEDDFARMKEDITQGQ